LFILQDNLSSVACYRFFPTTFCHALPNASVLLWGRTNFGEECITGPKSTCVGLEPNKYCHPRAYRSFTVIVEKFTPQWKVFIYWTQSILNNLSSCQTITDTANIYWLLIRQLENHWPSNRHQTNQIFPIITLVKFSPIITLVKFSSCQSDRQNNISYENEFVDFAETVSKIQS